MKKFLSLFIALIVFSSIYAIHQVDTIEIYSRRMNKIVRNAVIVPQNYNKKKRYPVVYILHGYSDNYSKWVNTAPIIKDLATQFQSIVVCPDGGFSSWYFDSPIDTTYQYETYITKELLPFIDTKYKTIVDRKARAITGHSMGGHGAMYIAIRHPDIFGNAGSMSGGVNLITSSGKYDVAKRIGNFATNPNEWENRSVINLVKQLKNNELNLIIDCGVDDFFYDDNVELHKRLVQLNINHHYLELPGKHDWDYWRNAIQYQFLFFKKMF